MKNEIIKLLKENYTLLEIAKELLNENSTININKLIKQYNINIENYGDKYKYKNKEWLKQQFDLYKTPSEVSKQTGIPRTSITRYAKKYNIYDKKFSRESKNSISENYFKEINTAHKAYWLGFIMADGNIYHYKDSDKIQFELKIQESDYALLNQFAKDIGFNKDKIRHRECIRKNTLCKYASLKSYNKVFCNNLINHGVVDRKSGKEILPNTVPDKYIKDFIRGFIDGDGSVKEDCLYIYSTSETIIDQINEYLIAHNLELYKREEKRDTYTMYILKTPKKILKQVVEFLYYDNCIALNRKYKIAKKIKSH